jgi:hypothetical protein
VRGKRDRVIGVPTDNAISVGSGSEVWLRRAASKAKFDVDEALDRPD